MSEFHNKDANVILTSANNANKVYFSIGEKNGLVTITTNDFYEENNKTNGFNLPSFLLLFSIQ